ncbi:MAG: hypothetical protein HZC36_00045 [Armatimonadetes bacterium]|nr:hypothetical protein [Armatimonadota bacterium]
MGEWRVRMFGGFGLSCENLSVERFDTQRSAKLLALLVLSKSGRMRRDDLADLLWPDDYLDATRLRLRQELSRLRRALGPASDILECDNQVAWVDSERLDSDVALLSRAAHADPTATATRQLLVSACARCAGEFLPSWTDDWAIAERASASALKIRCCVALGTLLLKEGDAEGALNGAREAIATDSCHEEARMLAVRAHAALGSLANAMAEFQQYKRELRERLGAEPSQEAQQAMAALAASTPEVPAATHPAGRPVLPTPIDRFFGREAEIGLIEGALETGRLATLVGPGGIGKTRLSVEAANRLKDRFAVTFVANFAELDSAPEFGRTLCEAAGLHAPSAGDPVLFLARSIGVSCLAVLDNLEHLLPLVAQDVKRLLEAAPGFKILATSRMPLGLAGENVLSIGPLANMDDARDLLFDLWRSSRPGLQRTPENLEQAERLAALLDRYPLALRLAAAHLKLRSPKDLVRRLKDRSQPLSSQAPDLEARHRSLESALNWSVSALSESNRIALQRLAWFRAGCAVNDLELVVGAENEASVEALVDSSLVAVDDQESELRLRLLEPIRQYVAKVATAEEALDAERSLVHWASSKLGEAIPTFLAPLSLDSLERLSRELDNFVAAEAAAQSGPPELAGKLAGAVWRLDLPRGRHSSVVARYEALEAESHKFELADQCAFTYGAAAALLGLGQEQRALPIVREGIRLAEQLGDPNMQGPMQCLCGMVQRRAGSLSEGLTCAQEGYSKLAQDADPLSRAHSAFSLATLLRYSNRLDESMAVYAEAYDLFNAAQDEVHLVSSGLVYGSFLQNRGDEPNGQAVLDHVRPLAQRLGDPQLLALWNEVDGRVAHDKGLYAEAERAFRTSLDLWTRMGVRYQITDQLTSLTRTLIAQRRLDEARDTMMRAARGWQAEQDWGGLNAHLTRAAEFHLVEGRQNRGAETLAFAEAMRLALGLTIVWTEVAYREDVTRGLGVPLPSVSFNGDPNSAMAFFDMPK